LTRFRKTSVPAEAGIRNPQLSRRYQNGTVASNAWLTSMLSIFPRATSTGSDLPE